MRTEDRMPRDRDPSHDGPKTSPPVALRAIPLAGLVVGASIAWWFGAGFVTGVFVGAAVGLGAYRYAARRFGA